MFRNSVSPQFVRILTEALLASILARPAAAYNVTPTVHLITAGASPIPLAWSAADFTEATFGGYADQAVTLIPTPVLLSGQTGVALRGTVNFQANNTITPPGQTIVGYFVDDGTGGGEMIAEYFADPVPIAADGDFLDIDILIPLHFTQDVE